MKTGSSLPLPQPVIDRLARLAPDQLAAATAPPGPVLCVAPAGSGKTTTLVARVAWLVASGVRPETIAAITFNRKAAVELGERLTPALVWAAVPAAGPGSVRVRTFHALGLEILRSTGRPMGRLVSRTRVLREIRPGADPSTLAALDAAISRFKLDQDLGAEMAAMSATPGSDEQAYVDYEAALARRGAIDFDDLVRLALRALESDLGLLARWRAACAHLLVDEAQDVDRSQLRLALLLAAPANRIFLVGDDDQSIYGWRLADVRRVLALADALPTLRRIDLEVNYRCPAPVVERAVRLVRHNRERFAKAIRTGPLNAGQLILAPDSSDDVVRIRRLLASWGSADGTWAMLARTNRELLPAVAIAVAAGLPFRAAGLRLPIEEPVVDAILDAVANEHVAGLPLLAAIGTVRDRLAREERTAAAAPPATLDEMADEDPAADEEAVPPASTVASALLGWAVPYSDLRVFRAAVEDARTRLADLRRDDAPFTLATAHATKGLEFDHVAVVGMDAGRFPSARAVAEAEEPERVLEEERRLAYVAWTRARRSLTLVYDPAAPSSFLLDAFEPAELGLPGAPSTP